MIFHKLGQIVPFWDRFSASESVKITKRLKLYFKSYMTVSEVHFLFNLPNKRLGTVKKMTSVWIWTSRGNPHPTTQKSVFPEKLGGVPPPHPLIEFHKQKYEI